MSLSTQLRSFLNSPRGRRLIEQGQRQLAKPENRAKIKQALNKIKTR